MYGGMLESGVQRGAAFAVLSPCARSVYQIQRKKVVQQKEAVIFSMDDRC